MAPPAAMLATVTAFVQDWSAQWPKMCAYES